MAASINVTFANLPGAAPNVVIMGPVSPTRIRTLPKHVTGRSANGTFRSYKLHAQDIAVWSLRFPNLTAQEADDLWTLVRTTLDGPSNTFDYTHTDGTTYVGCRILSDGLEFERTSDGEYETEIELQLPEGTGFVT